MGPEACPPPKGADDLDASTMHLDNGTSNCQAQPAARGACLADIGATVEALEDSGQLSLRDPRTSIADLDDRFAGRVGHLDVDHTAAPRELQRVAHQVVHE